MTLKGILFDFNGTLLFDSDLHMDAFRQVFPMFGQPAPTDEFMITRIFGRTNDTIYRENFDENAPADDVARFTEKKEELYQSNCLARPDVFRLIDGAEELLNYLKDKGVPFALATGSDLGNVSFYLRELGLDRWFSKENMVWDDGTYPGKPAPEIYRKAAAKLGLDPSACLVFEDGTSGIRSANAAGAGAVMVICEAKLPSPLTDETRVSGLYHDLRQWRAILAEYGLLR